MLNFIKTMSVNDFKDSVGAQSIDIKRNLKTGKPFFSCGKITGVVSAKCLDEGLREVVVSKVESDETGEVFLMLHSKGEGGVQRLASL